LKRIVLIAVCLLIAAGTVFAGGGRDRGTVQEKLVCGVTIFPPMNFQDENGNWTGFDTDFARIVGERLGMTVEFQIIDWGRKFIELRAGTINAIWNGMTANVVDAVTGRQRYHDVDFTYAYMLNTQAVVIRSSRVNEFQSTADLAGKVVAVEAGSAGASFARRYIGEGGRMVGTTAQIDTFIEVMSGAVDFGMVDILLAEQMVGRGDLTDLMIAPVEMPAEVYAIGFPVGSPMVPRVNKIIEELYNDGTLHALGRKYGVENRIVLNKTRIQDM